MNDVPGQNPSDQRLSDAVYHAVFDEAPDAIFVASSDGVYIAVNAQAEALTGYSRQELVGKRLAELIDSADLATTPLRTAKLLEGASMVVERRLRRRDGSVFDAELSASGLTDGKLLGFVRDVSQRKQLEAELRTSEARYRMAVPVSPDAIMHIDRRGCIQMLSSASLTLFGHTEAAHLLGQPLLSLVTPSDRERARSLLEEGGVERNMELALLRRDGSTVLCEVSCAVVPHPTAESDERLVYTRDITARKQAEARILHLSRLYALLSHVNQAVARSKDQSELLHAVCVAAVEQGGFRLAWVGMLNSTSGRVMPVTHAGHDATSFLEQMVVTIADEPNGRGPVGRALREEGFAKSDDVSSDPEMSPWRDAALQRGYLSVAAAAFRVRGRYVGILALYASEPNFFSHDECQLVREVAADISFALDSLEARAEQARADEALRASHLRFQSLVQNSMDVIGMYDADGSIAYLSPAVERVLGYRPEELLGMSTFDLMHPDDRLAAERELTELRKSDRVSHKSERRYRHRDGEYRWLEVVATNLLAEPTVQAIVKNFRDITERKQADAERQRLQAELSHAQKLESIGRLAGGVAHDFNNMLTVILGCAEAAMDDLDESEPLHEQLREVRDAALRSAELTRQLLTFARKQPYVAQVLDLNEILPLTMKLLRRLIRENIELLWKPGASLWPTRLDRTQLEQLITNLTVNARDAIEDAGQVFIETCNVSLPEGLDVPAGDYVRLTVRDTGAGIPEEILAHIFEPFFTTKAAGQGTGLGLSTAYGIVQQSSGFIRTKSHPGTGSEFNVYLPRFVGTAQQKTKETRVITPPATRSTVLLVEDDPSVLALVRTLLTRLGHRVLSAASGQEALRVANEHREGIDLVLTDIVMPGMNGVDLMTRLHTLRPDLPCIFMSGYATDVLTQTRADLAEVVLLRKPFTLDALAQALQHAERKPARAAAST